MKPLHSLFGIGLVAIASLASAADGLVEKSKARIASPRR